MDGQSVLVVEFGKMIEEQKAVTADQDEAEDEKQKSKASHLPLFPTHMNNNNTRSSDNSQNAASQWLCNSSFQLTDLSVINDTVVSSLPDEDDDQPSYPSRPASYELLEEESKSESDGEREKTNKKKKKKEKKRKRSREKGEVYDSFPSAKSKEYFFDSHGDRDNLVYGKLYRMNVPRYKLHDPEKLSRFYSGGLYRLSRRGFVLDREGDIDEMDGKLKLGRYWSTKYAVLEHHKNLKRVRLVMPRKSGILVDDDFIPLSDVQMSGEGSSVGDGSVVEESWEDEMLRKTREFNKLTREHPHDERGWLAFAEFQDCVASKQSNKGARMQILEKKISILEKAVQLNTDNEELLLSLMKAYQSRDSTDLLIVRWEKVLMQHSGSFKLWRQFLRVVQGEFSKFKVSDMRKLYANAIQALTVACGKQFRQVHQTVKPHSADPAIVKLELCLVEVFLSLCRLEWQAGYQEFTTALFQAEIEFSLFCPSLLLTEQSKQRLFEHFWNSDGARVGEEGALGWSTWLEKEEESRQKVINEEMAQGNDEGGWTGWSELISKSKDNGKNSEDFNDIVVDKEIEEEIDNEDTKQEDDTEALLKLLGIDVDTGLNDEVTDASTWGRWAEEESSRDCDQWMPIHTKCAAQISRSDGTPDREADEQLLKVILYEDVREFLFSLTSEEARLSLVSQFINFFGGRISQRICTNSSNWTENVLTLEALPDFLSENLRKIDNVQTDMQTTSSVFSLDILSRSTNDIYRRTGMMKFLRNAILQCLTAFPRNYILEEAALVAEELSVTEMNSCCCSVTPCRALAKGLLKSDRQDVLLCGVYAQREAFFGNIDHARRVFDMALSSIEELSSDAQSNAPLLYLWYAETELANIPVNDSESSFRAIHILSCLGSGLTYSTFKGQPSSLQILRAHQGYMERIKAVRSTWLQGVVNDQSIALICSAALFEELTREWAAGIEVLNVAFTMVLPERRSCSYELEFLFYFNVRMLQRHHKQSSLSKVWETILHGLQIYPYSPELFNTLVEIGNLYTTPNKLRWIFDDHCHKKPSIVVWFFALAFEISRGGSQHRIHGLFERALAQDEVRCSVVLWRWYIAYEINIACDLSAARRIFFQAIYACPWSKKLWLDGFTKLNSILTAKELSDLQEVMRDKELNLRTDIYEILLQEA
ncbi:hypothetical protein Dsin_005284 [Dipteronia sinensis]|uniref:Protein NRDE2 homolog n=1 Tax=Dipteronia sinensis TaxID=43782 RepID=A0AAE0AWL7_9ROSI|nr:hypothetical protein Dsin_005284 [Dipteronia sinensis]